VKICGENYLPQIHADSHGLNTDFCQTENSASIILLILQAEYYTSSFLLKYLSRKKFLQSTENKCEDFTLFILKKYGKPNGIQHAAE
jgi:hypothetical protein